jgi:hypothetical protein
MQPRRTVEIGQMNTHRQMVLRAEGLRSTTHWTQWVYRLGCSRCGRVYGSNGCDAWERRCPHCDRGKPPEPLRDPAAAQLWPPDDSFDPAEIEGDQ